MKIIDSVAAVFCHQGSILAVRRQSHLEAFPGYESFPGGKIDPEDPSSPHPACFLRDWDGQKMHALVREIQEELGYDLTEGIASGQVTSVTFLATAVAPAIVPVRFRLHFFRVDLKTRPLFTPDSGEIADYCWETPEQLLNVFHRGDSLMVPPLRRVITALVQNPHGLAFGDLSAQFDAEKHVSKFENISGLQMLLVSSNTLPPEQWTNAFLLGDEGSPQILVDPSPGTPEILERLLNTLQQECIDAVFLTHHHLDHHEHAPDLARHLRVPILMSDDTWVRIREKQGPGYFSGLRVELKKDGDCLTRWKGEAVHVHAVPGHDAGQLALAPESMRWFIVGDLIQRSGTVVISSPEGDMSAYFCTLEKVIGLDPAVIVPSHGMPMRSTLRLQAALQHRREREMAIRNLHADGKTLTEICDILYPRVEQRLLPYAMENIKSHLDKISSEGLLK